MIIHSLDLRFLLRQTEIVDKIYYTFLMFTSSPSRIRFYIFNLLFNIKLEVVSNE